MPVSRKCIAIFGLLAGGWAALAQVPDDQTTPAQNSNLNLFQRRPMAAGGDLSDPVCDATDLQTGGCGGSGTQTGITGRSSALRSNELSRSPNAPFAPASRRGELEDMQFRKVVEPPTEFQKFIEDAVGQKLPIYGASLFDQVPSTYAPVDRVAVAPDYAIGPGDELDVRLWGQITSEQRLMVDRAGDIFIPQVGRISVAGLHFIELAGALKVSIGRVFRNFEVSVNMSQLRSIQVFVMGHARRPGTYTVSSLSTLVNALFVSGGPSTQGSMRNIELKRSGQVVTHFDMYDLLLRGDKTKDATLKPGDVIFIPAAGARVAVAGSIENAAIYEIELPCSLREILGDAGGLSPVAAGQHAVLERVDNHATLISENLKLTGPGLDTPLQDGDIISLLELVPRFNRTVSLKGNVADPVRLPWHEGMRVSDLIPERRALLTRGYWTEHNRLRARPGGMEDLQSAGKEGTDSAGYTEEVRNVSMDTSLASAISGDKGVTQRKFERKNDFQAPAPDINWSYAAIERLDPQTLSTQLIAFNLGKAVLEHDEASDLELEPGDIVNVFSLADFTAPRDEQSRVVRLEGEVKMAGIYSVRPGETLRQLVARAGGLTDQAYLYAAEFTRESTKREQQKRLNDYLDQTEKELEQGSALLAGRTIAQQQSGWAQSTLDGQRAFLERLRNTPVSGRIVLELKPDSRGADALPETALENGDRLVVPAMPSTVSVMGTVYNQSTFLYKRDSNIRDYLKLSGGPTKYADAGHMFLIRADGATVSRAADSRFESIRVQPGDAVIVPTNLMKMSLMRNLLDWSQVISGFGLGAAAVNVLK
jgi:protein involved in polysaccharide export with SLBB domain